MNQPRNAGIDVLRGLSILLVVCHHLSLRLPLADTVLALVVPDRIIRTLSWGGDKAVVMFFVISGYLITRRAIAVFGALDHVKAGAFYRHRAGRILPLLLLLIAVLGILNLTGWGDYTFSNPQSFSGAAFAALTAHFNWYEARTDHYAPANWDVLWSLSVEEAFYLAFPLLCRMPSKLRIGLLLGLVAYGPVDQFLLQSSSDLWQEKAYGPGFAAIAAGVLAALLRDTLSRRMGGALTLAGGALVILALFYGRELFVVLGPLRPLCLIIGMALLLLGLDLRPLPERLRRATSWIQSCGRHSYEIYLSHMFIVLPAFMLWERSGWRSAISIVVFPVVIVGSALLGAWVFRRISRPTTKLFARVATICLRVKT